MANSPTPSPLPPGSAPDGNHDLIVSGMWVAKPFVAIEAFPEALVLTEADRRLAPRLAAPVCLSRHRFGDHVVELLLGRGEDRTVGLSMRIPTAANQFKDPYLLMEAEPGNTREVGVREFQFHLQGRLTDADLAAADWAAYFAAAAKRLDALRGAKGGAARKAKAARPGARKPARPGKARARRSGGRAPPRAGRRRARR